MNISAISFGNNPQITTFNEADFEPVRLDIPDVFDKQTPQPKGSHLKKDSFESSTKNKQAKKSTKKQPSIFKTRVKSFALGAIAAAGIKAGVDIAQAPSPYVTLNVNTPSGIVEIADRYDCDIDAIYAFNNLTPYSAIAPNTEIRVPTMYSNLQGEIDSLERQLYNRKLTSDERTKIEARISLLRQKQELQETLATVFTDGKYIYYKINGLDSSVSPEILSRFGNGIDVEQFKRIFDIKGSAINKNNKLGNSLGYNSDYDYFLNFTSNRLYAGTTIRVPKRAVNTDENINLNFQ